MCLGGTLLYGPCKCTENKRNKYVYREGTISSTSSIISIISLHLHYLFILQYFTVTLFKLTTLYYISDERTGYS